MQSADPDLRFMALNDLKNNLQNKIITPTPRICHEVVNSLSFSSPSIQTIAVELVGKLSQTHGQTVLDLVLSNQCSLTVKANALKACFSNSVDLVLPPSFKITNSTGFEIYAKKFKNTQIIPSMLELLKVEPVYNIFRILAELLPLASHELVQQTLTTLGKLPVSEELCKLIAKCPEQLHPLSHKIIIDFSDSELAESSLQAHAMTCKLTNLDLNDVCLQALSFEDDEDAAVRRSGALLASKLGNNVVLNKLRELLPTEQDEKVRIFIYQCCDVNKNEVISDLKFNRLSAFLAGLNMLKRTNYHTCMHVASMGVEKHPLKLQTQVLKLIDRYDEHIDSILLADFNLDVLHLVTTLRLVKFSKFIGQMLHTNKEALHALLELSDDLTEFGVVDDVLLNLNVRELSSNCVLFLAKVFKKLDPAKQVQVIDKLLANNIFNSEIFLMAPKQCAIKITRSILASNNNQAEKILLRFVGEFGSLKGDVVEYAITNKLLDLLHALQPIEINTSDMEVNTVVRVNDIEYLETHLNRDFRLLNTTQLSMLFVVYKFGGHFECHNMEVTNAHQAQVVGTYLATHQSALKQYTQNKFITEIFTAFCKQQQNFNETINHMQQQPTLRSAEGVACLIKTNSQISSFISSFKNEPEFVVDVLRLLPYEMQSFELVVKFFITIMQCSTAAPKTRQRALETLRFLCIKNADFEVLAQEVPYLLKPDISKVEVVAIGPFKHKEDKLLPLRIEALQTLLSISNRTKPDLYVVEQVAQYSLEDDHYCAMLACQLICAWHNIVPNALKQQILNKIEPLTTQPKENAGKIVFERHRELTLLVNQLKSILYDQ